MNTEPAFRRARQDRLRDGVAGLLVIAVSALVFWLLPLPAQAATAGPGSPPQAPCHLH